MLPNRTNALEVFESRKTEVYALYKDDVEKRRAWKEDANLLTYSDFCEVYALKQSLFGEVSVRLDVVEGIGSSLAQTRKLNLTCIRCVHHDHLWLQQRLVPK